MRKFLCQSVAFIASTLLVSACAASAANEETPLTLTESCAMQIDFSNSDAVRDWRVVNDGVMGGLSQGTRFAEEDYMTFQGTINTNGGGFSSLRLPMTPDVLAGATAMAMTLRSDGRQYSLTFRTSERWRGRSVSYQIDIPTTAPDTWTDVIVPFSDMRTSVFGRSVRANPFDPADVREMGIILADGIDGEFSLQIKQMSCAVAPSKV